MAAACAYHCHPTITATPWHVLHRRTVVADTAVWIESICDFPVVGETIVVGIRVAGGDDSEVVNEDSLVGTTNPGGEPEEVGIVAGKGGSDIGEVGVGEKAGG